CSATARLLPPSTELRYVEYSNVVRSSNRTFANAASEFAIRLRSPLNAVAIRALPVPAGGVPGPETKVTSPGLQLTSSLLYQVLYGKQTPGLVSPRRTV